MGNAPIFKPLDTETYRTRCENIVPSIYLTFISIIQGVALGLLAQQVFTFPPSPSTTARMECLVAKGPYAFITFCSMVVVTYEYIVLTLAHRYSYRLRDTAILFGLGFFQLGPIFFLAEPANWWVANALFSASGVIAFRNEMARNTPDAFGAHGQIYSMTASKLKADIWLASVGTLWSILAAYLVGVLETWHVSPMLLLVPFAIVQLFILHKERRYMKKLHSELRLTF